MRCHIFFVHFVLVTCRNWKNWRRRKSFVKRPECTKATWVTTMRSWKKSVNWPGSKNLALTYRCGLGKFPKVAVGLPDDTSPRVSRTQLMTTFFRRQLMRTETLIQADLQQLWDRYFVAAGPRLWNSIPAGLKWTDIRYEQFKKLLKTYLFGHWDRGTLWLV